MIKKSKLREVIRTEIKSIMSEATKSSSVGFIGDSRQNVPTNQMMSWDEIQQALGSNAKKVQEIINLLKQANTIASRASGVNTGRLGPSADKEIEQIMAPANKLTRQAEAMAKKLFGYVPYIGPNNRNPSQYEMIVDRRKVK